MNEGHGIDIPIHVERTGRKRTASIQVNNGRARVLVPRHLTDRDVSALIARKMEWIERTVRIQAGLVPAVRREYASGEVFTYLGSEYRLEVARGERESVRLTGGRFRVRIAQERANPAGVQRRLVAWYRSHALDQLQERTRRFASVLGVRQPYVTVKEYRSRWGSCTSDARITYNWKIIVAPGWIVDYVVVHELCHLIEHNHSPAYWRLVERVIPDYKDAKRWLRENGHLLEV